MTTANDHGFDPTLSLCVQTMLGKKPIDPVVLDLRGLTTVADAFVICHGRSNRQVMALAEHVLRILKKKGIRPLSVEGLKEGHWVLIDYGHVVVHLFYEPMRELYDLEGLWTDAGRININSMIGPDTGEKEDENG